MKVNDAIQVDAAGVATCVNCGKGLGSSSGDPLGGILRTERPSTAAGPGVRADPQLFADRPIVLRQTFCPHCLALLSTEIVPADEVSHRHWHVAS